MCARERNASKGMPLPVTASKVKAPVEVLLS